MNLRNNPPYTLRALSLRASTFAHEKSKVGQFPVCPRLGRMVASEEVSLHRHQRYWGPHCSRAEGELLLDAQIYMPVAMGVRMKFPN
jgi:hypothetical protein